MKNIFVCFFISIVIAGCKTATVPSSKVELPILLATVAPTPTLTSTAGEPGPKVLVEDLIENKMNYYAADADGLNPALIYSGPKPLMASLSQDGKKLAYFMGNSIYIQDVESGKTVTLNQEIIGSMGGQIRWSPDGTKLALECANSEQPSLAVCLFDATNGQMEVLVNEKNTDPFCSTGFIMLDDWSQDGSTMVYTCFIVPEQGQKQSFSIYLYDLASHISKMVFDGFAQSTIWSIGSSVSISPDKNYLLITGNHQDYILQVFILDLSTAKLKQLTNDPGFNSEALLWRSDSRTFYLHKSAIQIPYPESNFVMDINGNILDSVEINGTIIK